jgi:hypothetical protein
MFYRPGLHRILGNGSMWKLNPSRWCLTGRDSIEFWAMEAWENWIQGSDVRQVGFAEAERIWVDLIFCWSKTHFFQNKFSLQFINIFTSNLSAKSMTPRYTKGFVFSFLFPWLLLFQIKMRYVVLKLWISLFPPLGVERVQCVEWNTHPYFPSSSINETTPYLARPMSLPYTRKGEM